MTLQLDDLELLSQPTPSGVPLQLPVHDIDEDPQQPRQEFDPHKLQQLADSIERRGVLQAISVRPHPEAPQRWLLNFGARRLRAAKLLGRPTIAAYVDAGADRYDQVIENEQREELKPLELALFVQRRLALGETQVQIARGLGKSQPYVAYACALIDAPDWLMALYRQGKCQGLTELYHLRRLQALAPQRVLAWAQQRVGITRVDIQALKLELQTAAADGEGQCGSIDGLIEPAMDIIMTLEPPSAAPPPAQAALHRGPIAPTPADRAPTQRKQDRAPRSKAIASTASNASNSTRLALFAHHHEHLVEIVVDIAPDASGQVYVRYCDDDARLIVAASELDLIGIERVAQSALAAGEGVEKR
jgi:ParB family chromosome partitioning protein